MNFLLWDLNLNFIMKINNNTLKIIGKITFVIFALTTILSFVAVSNDIIVNEAPYFNFYFTLWCIIGLISYISISTLTTRSIKDIDFSNNTSTAIGDVNVSTNVITYPEKINCECGKEVKVTFQTIDSDTWDLICTCGKIAYKHPKREERREQINNMLNL